MQHFFPHLTFGPALTALILASFVGWAAHRIVFKTRLFDALLKSPLPPDFVGVPSTILVLIAGFLSAQVWQNSDHAQHALSDEILALSRIRNSAIEPQELQSAVRQGIEDYASLVREKEWGENYNNQPSTEVERKMEELRVMLRSGKAPGNGAGNLAAPASSDVLRYLESLELAREQRLELGSRSRFGYVGKWALLYLMMLVSAITVAAVHRSNPHTAAVALSLYCTAVALLFSMIALYLHPYKGPGAILPASLVVKQPVFG